MACPWTNFVSAAFPAAEHLDRAKAQIRLLKIASSQSSPDVKDGASLSCSLSVVSLDDKPQYHAISYAWELSPPQSLICLNGTPYLVRRNLWDLIHAISIGTFASVGLDAFWIDALCINQDDSEEKSSQVRMMGQIFGCAAAVLAWLGAGNDVHNSAETIAGFVETLKMKSEQEFGMVSTPHKLELFMIRHFGWRGRLHVDAEGNDDGTAKHGRHIALPTRPILTLCGQKYWTRLWIVQEYLVNSKLLILCGEQVFTAEFWYALVGVISTQLGKVRSPPFESTLAMPSQLAFDRYIVRNQSPMFKGIELLLQTNLNKTCTDPRDYVFGLLGIAQRGGDFEVDYTENIHSVFWKAMVHFRESDHAVLAECLFKNLHLHTLFPRSLSGAALTLTTQPNQRFWTYVSGFNVSIGASSYKLGLCTLKRGICTKSIHLCRCERCGYLVEQAWSTLIHTRQMWCYVTEVERNVAFLRNGILSGAEDSQEFRSPPWLGVEILQIPGASDGDCFALVHNFHGLEESTIECDAFQDAGAGFWRGLMRISANFLESFLTDYSVALSSESKAHKTKHAKEVWRAS